MDRVKEIKLTFDCPAGLWDMGFPIGNGDIGAMRFKKIKNSTEIEWFKTFSYGLNKVDIWDERIPAKEESLEENLKILEYIKKGEWDALRDMIDRNTGDYLNIPYPCVKPAGELLIADITVQRLSSFRETLDIYNGTLLTEYEYAFSETKVVSFVSAVKNVLVCKYDVKNKNISDRRVEIRESLEKVSLYRWKDAGDPTIPPPEFGTDGKFIWYKMSFPEGMSFVTMALVEGVDYTADISKDRVNAVLSAIHDGSFTVYTTIVTSKESGNPLDEAKKILSETASTGYENLLNEHTCWWHNFWNKSAIDIPDRKMEEQWYYQIYNLGCISREGKLCPGLAGLWNRFDNPPWHGQYYNDINLEMSFWPAFTANHLDLAEPYIRLFYDMLPVVKKETYLRYGIDGAKYPNCTVPKGNETTFFPFLVMASTPGRIAVLFWWMYKYSMDVNFLRDTAYPVMKEMLKFYLGLMYEENGTLVIFPSISPEQFTDNPYGVEHNPALDISVIKNLLKISIEAGEILNIDAESRDVWKTTLSKMPDYPEGASETGRKVFLDTSDASTDRFVYHVSLLNSVYPTGDTDVFDHKRLIAANTFEDIQRRVYWHSFNYAWLSSIAARLKLGNESYNLAVYLMENFGRPNYLFSLTPNHQMEVLQIECGGGLTAALNEILLQSFSGVIEVFPAIPDEWKDASFENLRAFGAFLVSSTLADGKVREIRITGETGGRCKLANPWNSNDINLIDSSGSRVEYTIKDTTIEFQTEKGRCYLISFIP